MATTTNYGWTTPDDTALVKDGASAIRTLGTSVDTTTKNLNPSTTLGDIEYRSSTANTNTRLGIGSTNQVLTVAGGVPTWATASSNGMTLISTTTLSGASTTISFSATGYNQIAFNWYGVDISGGDAGMQLHPNGSATISSFTTITSGGSTLNSYANFNSYIQANHGTSIKGANTDNAGWIVIDNPTSATNRKTFNHRTVWVNGNSTENSSLNQAGGITTNTELTSMGFVLDTGSRTFAAGTVKLWGIK